jgi:hypothetical protein
MPSKLNKILWTVDFTPPNPPELKSYALMIRKLYEQLARAFNAMVDVVNACNCGGGSSGVTSIFGRTGVVVSQTGDYTQTQIAAGAVANGSTATTQAALDASTKIATDAYVDSAAGVEKTRALAAEALLAPKASPALTGTPTGPTAAIGTNTTQLASTAFVQQAINPISVPGGILRRQTLISASGGGGTTLGAIGEPAVSQSSGTGTSATGKAPSASPAFGPSVLISSATGSISQGWSGSVSNYMVGRNIAFFFIGYIHLITNTRCWISLTDQIFATMTASDNPAGNYAAFRFSTGAGDTSWQAITKDGSTQTIVASGVAPVVDTTQTLAIIFTDSIPNIKFYINGSLVATIATHLPTVNTALKWVTSEFSTAASTHGLGFEQVAIYEDF